MTRISFDVGDWERRDYGGEAPLTPQAVAEEASTFQNARLWDYRPLRDSLDQLQTVRQYYIFTDVDTDRYQINDAKRQVMLSGPRARSGAQPAGRHVGQPADHVHPRDRRRDGPGQRGDRGRPAAADHPRPAVDVARRGAADHPAADLLRRAAERLDHHRRPPGGVRLPGRRDARPTASSNRARRPAGAGTTGVKLDTTMSRLLFALRFRDLNLMISDQVTADSQLLFHRSIGDRLPRIAPFLRYDKDPYLVVTDDGRLVYIQDAYTTSDRFPDAQWLDPSTLPGKSGFGDDAFNYVRNSVKIVMDAYTGDMTFYISDPADPIVRTYAADLPGPVHPLDRHAGRPPGPPAGPRGAVQQSRPGRTPATTSPIRPRSTTTRTCGRSRRIRAAPRACRTRRTTS